MPVIRLSRRDKDRIFDILDSDDPGIRYSDLPNHLNEIFAKIYGYKGTKHFRQATRRSVVTNRKLSSWNKFVKANSKKKIYRFANGKLKLKKMGIAYRKTQAYKRNKK